MRALVSGEAGVAVLIDGRQVSTLNAGASEEVLLTEADIPYLLADATDVAELLDTTREAAAVALDLACRKDEALHLFLILLDAKADREAQQLSADCLEELFSDQEVLEFVCNRLYSAPLPANSDLVAALIHADNARAGRLTNFLDELGSFQPAVRRWRESWDQLGADLFEQGLAQEEFRAAVITTGAFRRMVHAEPEEVDGVLLDCLANASLRKLPGYRRVLMAWTAPFRAAKARLRREIGVEEDEEQGKQARRTRRRSEKPKPSVIVFETVNKQKEAIKRLLSEGKTETALKYVEDLVRYQGDRSEAQDLARSLCDLAQHAKSMGEHKIQLALAQRAVQTVRTDGWSYIQVGDAYRCLGRLEEALQAYDHAVRDFPQNVVARTGRAEVLKEQGRLEEALQAYDHAVRGFPQDVVARNGRAEVLKELGRLEEALQAYDHAVRDFPQDVVARNGRAEVLKWLVRMEDALAYYEATLRDFPTDAAARNGKVSVLVQLGRYREAQALLPGGTPRTRNDWIAEHIRGMILMKQGDLDAAVHVFERGIRESPWRHSIPYFRGALSVALLRRKEFRKAVEAIANEDAPAPNILRLHAFGELAEIAEARKALARVEGSRLPRVIVLREELAARYVRPEAGRPHHSDDWVFERECDLLLAA